MILGFKPSDREMRAQAQRCWDTLKPRLNQHLLSEDETVLPWAEGAGGISAAALDRIKQSHLEMRALIGKLTGVSFAEDPDKVVSVAGKALCALAVKLDDLIDSEEMRLLPALTKDAVRIAPAFLFRAVPKNCALPNNVSVLLDKLAPTGVAD